MKRISFFAAFLALFSIPAFANSYVICGKSIDSESGAVSGYELELSSENDNYNGPVGKHWNLKMDQTSDWMAANKTITAKSSEDSAGNTIVEITLAEAQSSSGAVGTVYKLISLYDDQPVLEKYTMGGFAGSVKIGTFECESNID